MTDLTADLLVADVTAPTGSRSLDVDDFKAPATGASTEATLAAFEAASHTDLLALGTALAAVLAKQSADPSTGAKQDTLHADLAELLVLHTDLAAILAKESADPSTGANQTSANTKLDTLHTDLATLLAKIIAAPATEAKQDTGNTALASILAAAGATGDASTALTLIGLTKAIKAAVTGTLLVETASVSKAYQQLTSTAAAATVASLCTGAALPTGATKVILIPSAAVRFRDDGTDPSGTVGFPVSASQSFTYDADKLPALKVYGAATIDAWFYA